MGNINLFALNGQTLTSLQVAIKAVSDNVAHAQDPNFNARKAVFSDLSGVAVKIDVTRQVNTDLSNQLYDANAKLGGSDESLRMFGNMATIAGISNNNLGYIQDKMGAMQAAWNNFEASPDSAAAEAAIISSSDEFAAEIRRQFATVRQQESLESANVQVDVTELNSKLTQLAAVNLQAINQNGTSTGISPDTQDQMDGLIKDISTYVGVIVLPRTNGSVGVFTKGGIPLVDKIANQFAWDATNRNLYIQGGTVPASFNVVPSLNKSFAIGKIGVKVQALDPTSPPTAGTPPTTGLFQKYREQLSAFVDLFANKSTTVTNSAFDSKFVTNLSDRATDIVSVTTGGLPNPVTQGNGFFTTQPPPGTKLEEESFAVNANLLNGTRTVNRQAAPSMVSFFTSQTYNLGATAAAGTTTVGGTATLGGLTLVNRTPQGIASGITNFLAQNHSTVKSQDTADTTTQSGVQIRLQSQVGVNTDDELARLQVLQNLYAAAGRLMSTADTIFQTLLGIAR